MEGSMSFLLNRLHLCILTPGKQVARNPVIFSHLEEVSLGLLAFLHFAP